MLKMMNRQCRLMLLRSLKNCLQGNSVVQSFSCKLLHNAICNVPRIFVNSALANFQ